MRSGDGSPRDPAIEGRVVIAVMAKAPVRGQVKTRLVPRLGEEGALRLYRALLADKLAQLRQVHGVVPAVAFAPAEAAPAMREIAGPDVLLVAQRGADLGERLHHVSVDLFARGAAGVLLVDADTPTLPVGLLAEGAAALAPGTIVLGPAWDGGYYLLGLQKPCAELFSGVAWSTRRVLSQTVALARASGLGSRFLQSWGDVDEPADLDRLARELALLPEWTPAYPVHTKAALDSLGVRAAAAPRDAVWKTLATRRTYANPWVRLSESVVEIGAGLLTLYGVVDCGPCVGVLPVLGDGRVVLVRQFRYVTQQSPWEMPTGGVKAGEPLEAAARRELQEEAGFAAGELVSLGHFDTSKSIVAERAHLFAATGLLPVAAAPDETEQLEVASMSLEQAFALCDSGEIVDSMTLVALHRYARGLGRG